jgi:hypothetical protein
LIELARGVSTVVMSIKFTDFMAELLEGAKAEGPEAIAELKYFRARYRLARRSAGAPRKRGRARKTLAEKT